VSRISIEVEADDIVRVNVQTYLLLKEAEMLATLIRTEYKLVRTDKEPEIVPE
jgi:predicted ATP-grasp superfamily ATP-dependent carboligase